MNQRTTGDHLGVEQGLASDLPPKIAAVPITQVHHRGGAKTVGKAGHRVIAKR
jgi:hypothetical protein